MPEVSDLQISGVNGLIKVRMLRTARYKLECIKLSEASREGLCRKQIH